MVGLAQYVSPYLASGRMGLTFLLGLQFLHHMLHQGYMKRYTVSHSLTMHEPLMSVGSDKYVVPFVCLFQCLLCI